jgi:hypothetical protein
MPRLPLLLLTPTIACTLAARVEPAVFTSLRRDPGALARGELWRSLSPVLVQADLLQPGGVWRSIAVWALVAALLAAAERTFGGARSFALDLIGALVGHGVGELWQPLSSGCSVAGCGVLGGLALWLSRATPVPLRLSGGLWLVAAAVATSLADIHGRPLLAGALAGAWLCRTVPLPPSWTGAGA